MEAEVEEVDVEGDGSSTCICITAAAAILYCFIILFFVCVYFVLDFFVVMMLYAINGNEADACYYKEKLPSITLLLRRLVDLIWCSLWQDSFTK